MAHERTISIHTENANVLTLEYGTETTILDLKLKLQSKKGYSIYEHELCFHGEAGKAVAANRLVEQVAREVDSDGLCLSRVSKAPSATANQSQSSHSYAKVKAEEMAQQLLGNIGVLRDKGSFGGHVYNDIQAKGRSVQVLGDMTSFPPGFGAARRGV